MEKINTHLNIKKTTNQEHCEHIIWKKQQQLYRSWQNRHFTINRHESHVASPGLRSLGTKSISAMAELGFATNY
jgi:hypothetical protein